MIKAVTKLLGTKSNNSLIRELQSLLENIEINFSATGVEVQMPVEHIIRVYDFPLFQFFIGPLHIHVRWSNTKMDDDNVNTIRTQSPNPKVIKTFIVNSKHVNQ